jgi:putative polyhydroxyalkanoate system protein
MSTIKIERKHSLGEDAVRNRVGEIEPMLKEKFGVRLAWRGKDADIEGRGVSGSVRISGDILAIDLKLGLLVRPFAAKIRRVMEARIDEALG